MNRPCPVSFPQRPLCPNEADLTVHMGGSHVDKPTHSTRPQIVTDTQMTGRHDNFPTSCWEVLPEVKVCCFMAPRRHHRNVLKLYPRNVICLHTRETRSRAEHHSRLKELAAGTLNSSTGLRLFYVATMLHVRYSHAACHVCTLQALSGGTGRKCAAHSVWAHQEQQGWARHG